MRRLFTLAAILATIALLAAACGGGTTSEPDDNFWPEVLELKDREITVLLGNSQLAIGDDRFLFILQDSEGQLILNAQVTTRFFTLEGEEGTLRVETATRFVSLEENQVHEHEDGTLHTHTGNDVGGYVVAFRFDEAGSWGVEVEGQRDGEKFDPLRVRFTVLEQGTVPGIGEPAPRSQQLTLSDVADISEIDTSNPPRPELHDLTVAEALDAGKPIVVAFATPAFCTSRLCGPVVDEVLVPLYEQYGDQATFIHIEPYVLEDARAGRGLIPVAALAEWGLQSEPFVFVVDSDGLIAGKFEGITNAEEVGAALEDLLGPS